MPRAHYVDTILGLSSAGALSVLDGASVTVCDQGTTTPISATLYTSDAGSGTRTNPFLSASDGMVEFWLDDPARVTLRITKTGYGTNTRTVDVEDAPGAAGSGSSSFQVTTTDLLAADITALDAVALDLTPEPASDKSVVPVGAWLENDTGGTDYTTSASLWIGYANDPLGDGTSIQIPALRLNSVAYPLYYASQNGGQAFPVACKGQRLVLKATGPIIGGTRTAKLTVLWFEA